MNCPKCGTELEKNFCKNCNKSLKDIYFRLSDDAQGNRDYNTAILYLEDLIGLTEDESEKNEIKRIRDGIEFIRMNEIERGEKAVNPKKVELKMWIKVPAVIRKILLTVLGIFVSIITIFYGIKFINNYRIASDKIIDGRREKVSIVLPIEYNGKTEETLYYKKLLKIILDNRKIKVNIAVSGEELALMRIKDSEFFKMIKEGIKLGQFEICGEFYSMAIPPENLLIREMQIKYDKEFKKKYLGKEPQFFINKTDIWDENLVDITEKFGYKDILISENTILNKGLKDSEHIKILADKKTIAIVSNTILNEKIANYVNESLEKTGKNILDIRNQMRKSYLKDKAGNRILQIYIENEDYKNSDEKIDRLKKLLDYFTEKNWLKITLNSEESFDDYLAEAVTLKYNIGNKRFEKIEKSADYKAYLETRKELRVFESNLAVDIEYFNGNLFNKNIAIKNISKAALDIIVNGQNGIGLMNKKELDIRTKEISSILNILKEAINISENSQDTYYEKEFESGKTEIIVVNSEKLYVFDKNSSRLLFWMDLKKGTILSETVNLSDNSSEFVSNLTGSSIAVYNTETMIEKNSNGIIFTKNGIKKIVELDNEGYKVKYSGAVSEILEAVIPLQPDYNSLSGKVSFKIEEGNVYISNGLNTLVIKSNGTASLIEDIKGGKLIKINSNSQNLIIKVSEEKDNNVTMAGFSKKNRLF